MHDFPLTFAKIAVVVFASISIAWAAQQSNPDELFQRLQVDSSTDDATTRLLNNAKTDGETKVYLAAYLPELINKGPNADPRPWTNAVKLAGELKVSETIPSLVPWIGHNGGSRPTVVTMATVVGLDRSPAAKALAEIGDPSVPAVSKILDEGSRHERYIAVYILNQIHSPVALQALREHYQKEPDQGLKDLIQRVLSSKTPQ